MTRTVRRTLARALILPVAITASVGIGHGIGLLIAPDDRLVTQPATPGPTVPTDLMERYACSTTGLGEGVIPAHALVRRDGRVSLTSFDDGWATYQGARPGDLVAVCAR